MDLFPVSACLLAYQEQSCLCKDSDLSCCPVLPRELDLTPAGPSCRASAPGCPMTQDPSHPSWDPYLCLPHPQAAVFDLEKKLPLHFPLLHPILPTHRQHSLCSSLAGAHLPQDRGSLPRLPGKDPIFLAASNCFLHIQVLISTSVSKGTSGPPSSQDYPNRLLSNQLLFPPAPAPQSPKEEGGASGARL